ncbi:gamma-glutamyl-gamma-aminobutyrate hydrolase family protein [Paraburkholderia caballeronis]|uniref:gamma-glutamyl-gamma-aminobutyrate hydrolase family protein n=1 Tax=Paraburkholderia caballeronis TaxID=416943 RepID=UPI0010652966|nr:type 1 glutamine amidotransferase [Paraburkholderia caballeronis]
MSENKPDSSATPADAGFSRVSSDPPAGVSAGPSSSASGSASAAAKAAAPGAAPSQRASTDAPTSASTVTPERTDARDTGEASEAQAAQARVQAAQAVVQQAVEQGTATGAAAAATLAATDAAPVSAAAGAAAVEPAGASDAADTAAAADDAATADPGAATRAGAAPAGFGQAPDFTAQNPPPPGALPPNPPRYLHASDSAWSVLGRIIAARMRQLFDRAGQRITQRTLRIGVSARIFHPEPGAVGLRGKTLQYLEESIAHWVMSRDVVVFMIPTVGHQGMLHPSNIRLRDYAKHLDGLLLQGGADVSPQTYEEVAARPEWPGDRVRDMYELELLHEFVESGKPVLGVCRGCQLINVAFGGTLYQDIATDVPTASVHVSEHYDQHRHAIHFPDGSTFASMFPGRREAIVNSIHHQAVKTLGRDLNIEAVSAGDGLIEAVRHRRSPFVVGVQWHPEFHRAGGPELLDCTPLLDTFLRAARETRF